MEIDELKGKTPSVYNNINHAYKKIRSANHCDVPVLLTLDHFLHVHQTENAALLNNRVGILLGQHLHEKTNTLSTST